MGAATTYEELLILATGSLRPADYSDVTRNASYFIGMLMAANE